MTDHPLGDLTLGDEPSRGDLTTPQVAPTAGPAPAPLTDGTRYRAVRFHARGGLGEVYVAEDLELHREVALKCLRSRAGGELGRARFVREAAVTGRLEHPGVVPIYGLLSGPDGQPFYAMRFIRGETLQDAVDRFHADAGAPASERALELRALLQRFTAVCNTIAYAHAQGFIHRDLKPANVMLGEYGETLVVDWGLAKLVAAATTGPKIPPRQSDPSDGEVLLAGADTEPTPDSRELTHAGSVIGTPAYMSPEQASGEPLGPPSDIYSLGAMLYAILTGQPPFRGGMPQVILEDVRTARYTPPRRLRPEVPSALEAICLKAMRLRPDARYATARDVAADIDRWLADEPVSAWAEPWRARLGRRLRRHRAWVAAAFGLLIVTAAFMAAFAVHADRAAERTAAESKRAKANLDRAMLAVDKTLNHLSDERFIRIPQFDIERRKILTDALELTKALLEENATEPQVRLQTGIAAVRTGRIHALLGENSESKTATRRAIELLEALVAERPDIIEATKALALAYEQLARTVMDGDEQKPVDDEEIVFHVRSEARRGQRHLTGDTGRYAPAVRDEVADLCRRCIAVWERFGERAPNDLEYRFRLAEIHYRLAHLLVHTGQRDAGEAEFRKTLKNQKAMVQAYPDDPNSNALLGSIDLSAGAHYLRTGQWDEAEIAFREGTSLYETVAPTDPTKEKWQIELGYGRHAVALMHQLAQRWAQAEAGYRAAFAIREPLARNHQDVWDYQFDLARTRLNHAAVLLSAGRPSEALPVFDEVLDRLAPVRDKAPNDPNLKQFQAHAHRGRAETLTALTRFDDALAAWDRALEFVAPRDRDLFRIRRLVAEFRKLGPSAADRLPELLRNADAEPGLLFEAACALAEASPAVHDRAVALLKRCAAAGHLRDPAVHIQLLQAPELTELRKRDDVQDLIRKSASKPTEG